jgi:putative heme-binding domain-containing protein
VRKDGSVSKGKAARIFRCRPDGSDVEVVCGGGMDNPVEIAFTDEGEPFVTVDILHNQPSRNDGIIYAIEGGNYPWHEVSKEFPRTGDLLPAIENLGWVAPSGIMRYRSGSHGFGVEFKNNLFTAQFNRHRIQRHIVERDGAGFKCKTEDFLTTDDKNFHPTEVFEDADGSLIVIDTGGWFRIGCPTSQLARPEIKGAIYRIRKTDMPLMTQKRVDQLRGVGFQWTEAPPFTVAQRLQTRPALSDQAIQELANRGKPALAVLGKIIEKEPFPSTIKPAIWTATRIEHADARTFVRSWLTDKDLGVQLAAIHSAGLHRDAKALPALLRVVAKADPAAQRQAATALGRIKNPNAIEPIMEAMREAKGDRFLEHALIYALIQIDNRDKTAPFLNDRDPAVRRACLIALDQMPHGELTREELSGQLNSDHKLLVAAALDIVAARPKWASEITGQLREWLADADPSRHERLRSLLLALSRESDVQDLVVSSLRDKKTPTATRVLLMDAIGRAPMAKLPAAWLAELERALDHSDDAVAQQAMAAIRTRSFTQFDAALERIVHHTERGDATRVQAFGIVSPRLSMVDGVTFGLVMRALEEKQPPLLRLAAAKGLSHAKMNSVQLTQLALHLATAGPLDLPPLLAAFEQNASEEVGAELLKSLEKNKSIASLTPGAIDKAFQRCPDTIRAHAAKVAAGLQSDAGKQRKRIDELESLASGGSLERGRDIFFGNKASCSACHAINNKGGGVGPDLGKIGAIRSSRDLLESIAFPSASFARGYEPYVVETKAGKSFNGILARESADAVHLMTTDRTEIRVPRDEIESILPGRVSIMPQGLDTALTRRELQDLLAYLQSLR